MGRRIGNKTDKEKTVIVEFLFPFQSLFLESLEIKNLLQINLSFFLHFSRPNTRALCTQVALPGLRPFVYPFNGLGLRPRYARNKY